MESMVETAKRAKDTVSDYLKRRGMEIVDDEGVGMTDFVAWDDDSLVFVTMVVRLHSAEELPDAEETRSHRARAEKEAADWLSRNGDEGTAGVPVRFDMASILILNGSMALLRYHSHAFEGEL